MIFLVSVQSAMKLKQSPDDFFVEERTTLQTSTHGDFAFYSLAKSGWTTPDALQIIEKNWKIPSHRFSFGGLKDRHAKTVQFLTILNGPQKDFHQQEIHLHYLGQLARGYCSEDISANFFRLVLRSMTEAEIAAGSIALEELSEVGVANYFDDQRFGSVNADQRFIAREMIDGRFEEALKLALLSSYEHDRSQSKREKEILSRHWGDWRTCRLKLPKSPFRRLLQFLSHHPDDFRGAVTHLHPELQGLHLAAYQSHLWNKMLAFWLEQNAPRDSLQWLPMKLGTFPTPRNWDAESQKKWEELLFPLPSARIKIDPEAPWAIPLQKVMEAEGLPLADMKIPGLRKPFFSKGERTAIVRPEKLFHKTELDEKHPGRQKLILEFELPRGCYATMIVKRITSPAPISEIPCR